MFNRFKTTTLAAITAAATLLWGGQAWADLREIRVMVFPSAVPGAGVYPLNGGLEWDFSTGTEVVVSIDDQDSQTNIFNDFQNRGWREQFLTSPLGSIPAGAAVSALGKSAVSSTDGSVRLNIGYIDYHIGGVQQGTVQNLLVVEVVSGVFDSSIRYRQTASNFNGDMGYMQPAPAPDTIAPTIAITSDVSSLAAGETAAITFTLSEVSTNFVEGDVTITGGTLSNFAGSGTSYTATFTPTAGSTANGVIFVDSGTFTDAAGNANADGADTNNTATLSVDGIAPKVVLSGAPATLTNTDPFTVTATFDENVTGFDDFLNDVIVTNGTVTAITGGPAVYTLAITPTGNDDVSITVPVAAAQDGTGNPNSASNTLEVINQIVEITQEAIAGFMLGRANNLASNQPGLTRFLMGDDCGGAFSANATEGSGSISGCVSQGNTWAEITGAWSGDDSYTLGTFGAHSFINPNLLIGGMLQFDYAEDSANNASGTGWMVGPYFVAQVPDQPLFFEGRLLYGQTDNDISPLGTYTDSFETERWLAQLRATGEYQYQATTLMPLLDFTYTDDTQKAYTDSLGNTIPGQTVSLMQVSAGMDFSTPIPVSTGALELIGGLSGIYSSTDGGAAAPEFENWRGRTHLGLNYVMANGATLSATTFYDGLGTDYESYGASLGFDMKF